MEHPSIGSTASYIDFTHGLANAPAVPEFLSRGVTFYFLSDTTKMTFLWNDRQPQLTSFLLERESRSVVTGVPSFFKTMMHVRSLCG